MAKAKPTDATGQLREQLIDENFKEMEERAATMSMATAQAKIDLDKVIDATNPSIPTVIVDEAVTLAKETDDTIEIRVVEDIENMTLGVGNTYSFKAGQRYRVTKRVANHLKEKGYLAGVI